MIEVTNTLIAYPEYDEGVSGIRSLTVKSHWKDPEKIILLVEGCPVTVLAEDLLAAIKNSTNSRREK